MGDIGTTLSTSAVNCPTDFSRSMAGQTACEVRNSEVSKPTLAMENVFGGIGAYGEASRHSGIH